MNKDTVVASVIGFGLGLIAAIALWVVPRILPKKVPAASSPVAEATAESTPSNSPRDSNFTLSTPIDGDISQDKGIKIEGTASKDAVIVVSTASNSATITPKNDGSFNTSLDLVEGGNHIVVSHYSQSATDVKELFIYYYPDQI